MPSKSKAQFGKMGQLFKEGKISKKTLDEFNGGVDPNNLPERSGPNKKKGVRSVDDIRAEYTNRFGIKK